MRQKLGEGHANYGLIFASRLGTPLDQNAPRMLLARSSTYRARARLVRAAKRCQASPMGLG
ncbi:MAG: hypothetical protein H0V51_23655 [Chloroflexi bacterium]|nr:hypothetical protein [Chloroflexota bacterium]